MRPSGLRQHAVVTYLTRAEADVVDVARLLDGGASAQPRSAWLVARARWSAWMPTPPRAAGWRRVHSRSSA